MGSDVNWNNWEFSKNTCKDQWNNACNAWLRSFPRYIYWYNLFRCVFYHVLPQSTTVNLSQYTRVGTSNLEVFGKQFEFSNICRTLDSLDFLQFDISWINSFNITRLSWLLSNDDIVLLFEYQNNNIPFLQAPLKMIELLKYFIQILILITYHNTMNWENGTIQAKTRMVSFCLIAIVCDSHNGK